MKVRELDIYWKLRNTYFFGLVHFFLAIFRYCLKTKFKFSVIEESVEEKNGSKTLLILGAGKSVLEIMDVFDSPAISNIDILALSYAVIISDKIDYFVYEAPSVSDSYYGNEHLLKLLPKVKNSLENKKLKQAIWKNPNRSNKDIINTGISWKWVFTWVIPMDAPEKIVSVIRFFYKTKLSKLILLQKRGTLVAMVNWAITVGYNKIIFAGIDLKDTAYFFEGEEKFSHYGFKSPSTLFEDDKRDCKVHPSNDPKFGAPMSEILRIVMMAHPDVKMYVTSQNSKLSEIMPVYDIWEAVND